MNNVLFEQLVRNYPSLFQKSDVSSIAVGDGWYNLIDSLCAMIYGNIDSCRQQIIHCQNNNQEDGVAFRQSELDTMISRLPKILQIKEKYGRLRFYISGGIDEHMSYIHFAEHMSGKLCVMCGAPGEYRNDTDGISTVLCDAHNTLKRSEENFSTAHFRNRRPMRNISDDE